LILVFIYWQFLSHRYVQSVYTRRVAAAIGIKADSIFNHPASPSFIKVVYTKIRHFLSSFIQVQMQQAQQQYHQQAQ